MIVTVTLNPAVDKTGVIENLALGAVNRMQSVRVDPGGKGINVSKTLHALGQQSRALGILGGDTGRMIDGALMRMGILTDFVMVRQPTRTNLKLIDPVSGTTTDINEPGQSVCSATLNEVRDRLLNGLQAGDIVVFSGSLPPGAAQSIYRDWAKECRGAGAKTFVDADGESLRLAAEAVPYAVKPNEHELSRLTGRRLNTVEALHAAGQELVSSGIRRVVISMGGAGALFLSPEEAWYGHGLKVEAQSTVGAGDAMMAALCYGEEHGLPFTGTARLAVAVSAASVMRSGSQSADPEAVRVLSEKVVLEKL